MSALDLLFDQPQDNLKKGTLGTQSMSMGQAEAEMKVGLRTQKPSKQLSLFSAHLVEGSDQV